MPRTVVPPQPATAPGAGGAAGDPTDKLPEKLAKYVPAETLGFFVPISAVIGTGDEALLIAVIAVALVGTPAYLWMVAPNAPDPTRPRVFFYALAELALACWLVGTSGVTQHLVGVSDKAGGVILGCATFLIPIIDGVLNKAFPRK